MLSRNLCTNELLEKFDKYFTSKRLRSNALYINVSENILF